GTEPHRLGLRADATDHPRVLAAEAPRSSRGALGAGNARRSVRRLRARQVDRRAAAPEAVAVWFSERAHVRRRRVLWRGDLRAVDDRDAPAVAMGGHDRHAAADRGRRGEPTLPAIALAQRRRGRRDRRSRLLAVFLDGRGSAAWAFAVRRAGGEGPRLDASLDQRRA